MVAAPGDAGALVVGCVVGSAGSVGSVGSVGVEPLLGATSFPVVTAARLIVFTRLLLFAGAPDELDVPVSATFCGTNGSLASKEVKSASWPSSGAGARSASTTIASPADVAETA